MHTLSLVCFTLPCGCVTLGAVGGEKTDLNAQTDGEP